MNGNSMLEKNKVVEVFNKMDYGEAMESIELAEKWLASTFTKSKSEGDKCVDVINVITGNVAVTLDKGNKMKDDDLAGTAPTFNSAWEQLNFFNEIINEMKKHVELIVQLEMCIRGFSRKDTMKSLNLFFEYLQYYSTINALTPTIMRLPLRTNPLSILGYCIGTATSDANRIELPPREYIIVKTIFELIKVQCQKYKVSICIEPVTGSQECAPNVKTPVLIFSDADLDSACESIINAAWSEQGQMPWSVNTVFVQEDVLQDFVLKLKHRLNQVKIGSSNNKQVDFTFPYLIENYQSNYASMIADAKSKGIEVYRPNAKQKEYQPTLFIGGKLYSNNVIKPSEPCVPYLNVMGFRSIKEGVTLCNNQQQTFAATVWAENVGLITEIVQKLNVGTVWVNNHGVFNANVPYYFDNYNIVGYHTYQHSWEPRNHKLPKDVPNELSALITIARFAQVAWSKKSRNERIQVLHSVAEKLKSVNASEKWINLLIGYPRKEKMVSQTQIYGSYELKQFSEPMGVIMVYLSEDDTFKEEVISALLNGNSIIVENSENDDDMKFIYEMSTQLQGLICPLISKKCHILYCQGIYTYLINRHLPDFNFSRFKNVWTSIGENYV